MTLAKKTTRLLSILVIALVVAVFTSGCAKKAPHLSATEIAARRKAIVNDPDLTPDQKHKEIAALTAPPPNPFILPFLLFAALSPGFAVGYTRVRKKKEADEQEILRRRRLIEKRMRAPVGHAPPPPDPFVAAQRRVEAIPHSQRGASFFTSCPLAVDDLVEVTIMVNYQVHVVYATPAEAAAVRGGNTPLVRAFTVGDTRLPWYEWKGYEPYLHYWKAASTDWVWRESGVRASWMELEDVEPSLSAYFDTTPGEAIDWDEAIKPKPIVRRWAGRDLHLPKCRVVVDNPAFRRSRGGNRKRSAKEDETKAAPIPKFRKRGKRDVRKGRSAPAVNAVTAQVPKGPKRTRANDQRRIPEPVKTPVVETTIRPTASPKRISAAPKPDVARPTRSGKPLRKAAATAEVDESWVAPNNVGVNASAPLSVAASGLVNVAAKAAGSVEASAAVGVETPSGVTQDEPQLRGADALSESLAVVSPDGSESLGGVVSRRPPVDVEAAVSAAPRPANAPVDESRAMGVDASAEGRDGNFTARTVSELAASGSVVANPVPSTSRSRAFDVEETRSARSIGADDPDVDLRREHVTSEAVSEQPSRVTGDFSEQNWNAPTSLASPTLPALREATSSRQPRPRTVPRRTFASSRNPSGLLAAKTSEAASAQPVEVAQEQDEVQEVAVAWGAATTLPENVAPVGFVVVKHEFAAETYRSLSRRSRQRVVPDASKSIASHVSSPTARAHSTFARKTSPKSNRTQLPKQLPLPPQPYGPFMPSVSARVTRTVKVDVPRKVSAPVQPPIQVAFVDDGTQRLQPIFAKDFVSRGERLGKARPVAAYHRRKSETAADAAPYRRRVFVTPVRLMGGSAKGGGNGVVGRLRKSRGE